jgi:hypothetical protein
MVALGAVLLAPPLLAQHAASDLANLRHWSGQGVAPVYEGFDINDDGSFNMWFGYMNRNYEEEVDVPVGADNLFEPGMDRGQPTHFITRRHKDVFSVRVPKDFGDQQLVWKLNVHGQSQQVVATLKPVWQIDRLRTTRGGNSEKISSNLPPSVKVETSNQGSGAATLTVSAIDDGLPKRRGEPVGLTVLWAKFRGPGAVQFSQAQAKLVNGQATTSATFSEPGEYVLQAVVDDGSGESAGNFGYHCCWTNAQVKLTVKGAGISTAAATRPVITPAPPRRCRSSPTTKCGRGRGRFASGWRTATCRRGTSTRRSAFVTTRTTARSTTTRSRPSCAGSTPARRSATPPTCRRRWRSARKPTGSSASRI